MANDGPFRPTPEDALRQAPARLLSEHGEKALSIINEGQHSSDYPYLDLEGAIILRDVHQFKPKFFGESPYIARETISFKKEMITELLSKIEPGKTVEVKGEAIYRGYLKTLGGYYLNPRNTDTYLRGNKKVSIKLNLSLELSEDSKKVVFSYNPEKEALPRKLVFREKERVEKPKPRSFLSRLLRRK